MQRTFAILGIVFAMAAAPEAAALSSADQRIVARIETYLNAMRTLSARFVQEERNGWIAEGRIYLQRPGKMRIEYAPPHRFLIVTTGRMLIVYNGRTDQTTYLPMSTSPVAFLLAARVDLRRNARVIRVERRPDVYILTVAAAGRSAGSLTLTFARKPFGLKEWTVTDAKRKTVRIVLLDPRIDAPIDPVKFLFEKPGPARPERRPRAPARIRSTDLPPR